MLYKSISSRNGKYFDFIKYTDDYKKQLEKLNELSPQYAKAVKDFPSIFSELSKYQSYLLIENQYSLLGAVIIDASEDEQLLKIALFFDDETLKTEYFSELVNEIIDSLGNYFYDKAEIEITFANQIDEELLKESLGLEKRQYDENSVTYYKDNEANKTVPLLLEEMKYAEKYLTDLKLYWIENSGIAIYEFTTEVDDELIEQYYKHTTGDKIFYKANIVRWEGITSKKSNRSISFSKDGKISFDKGIGFSGSNSPQYSAECNIKNQDFEINATQPVFDGKYDFRNKKTYTKNNYVLSRKNNIYSISMNEVFIEYDIEKGTKTYHILNAYDKTQNRNASIELLAKLDEENNVSSGFVQIVSHKGNGKVNGTYRIKVNEFGIDANFYSRKGDKYNLLENPLLASNLLMLTSGEKENKTFGENITGNLLSKTIEPYSTIEQPRVLNFDTSNFNLEAIYNAEKQALRFFKEISGEIPIKALDERLRKSIEYFNRQKSNEDKGHSKKLNFR